MTLEVVVLTAGEASRMPDAPYGCKSLIDLGGRPVIEWQVGAFPEDHHLTIVGRHRVSRKFDAYDCEFIAHEEADGPVRALQRVPIDGPVLVVFADTVFETCPDVWHDSWVGVAVARGGRIWEFAGADGVVRRRHVPALRHLAVHCGLYYFHDPERLATAMYDQPVWYRMLNNYVIRRDECIEGWLDVGDPDSFERAEAYIAGEQ